jgi:hypothetical protein
VAVHGVAALHFDIVTLGKLIRNDLFQFVAEVQNVRLLNINYVTDFILIQFKGGLPFAYAQNGSNIAAADAGFAPGKEFGSIHAVTSSSSIAAHFSQMPFSRSSIRQTSPHSSHSV